MWEQWWRTIRREWWGDAKAQDSLEDPEILIQQAQEEMRQMHAKNRERAVKAITQKNQLQLMVEETERRVAQVQEKLEAACARGDEDIARALLREKQDYEQTLHLTRTQLEQAIVIAEQVKQAIQREEEKIRQRTAHAMALQAQWKMIQIEQAITVSLAQVGTGEKNRLTREEILARHERNREYVAEAYAQKHRLEEMVSQADKTVHSLREKADIARQRGDDGMECQLLREMEQYEATLAQSREALQRATLVAERARDMVQEEAVRVRALGEAGPEPPLPFVTATPTRSISGDEEDNAGLIVLSVLGGVLIGCVLIVWWMLRGGV